MEEMDSERERSPCVPAKGLEKGIEHTQINGNRDKRLPNILNMSTGYVEGEGLMMAIKGHRLLLRLGLHQRSLEPARAQEPRRR